MKTFVTVTFLICIFLGCSKELIEGPNKGVEKIYSVEDFANISPTTRDGVKPTVTAPKTAVVFNVFDSTQMAINQRLLIKPTDYLRMGNESVNWNGILCGNYIITFFFSTHDTIIKSFAPTSYGNHYTVSPNLVYNQFDISAHDEFLKLKKTKRFSNYYDKKCTKPKVEFLYEVKTNTFNGFETYEPNKCNTYGYSYDLIF